MEKFQIGDIVTKKQGKKSAEIISKGWGNDSWNCRYLHSKQSFYAYACDLKLYTEETEMTADTKTLYSFTDDNGTTVFGTHIGTNSSNQYIIEIKGGGGIVIKDQKDLEEVLPYTFSVNIGGKEIHYIGEPGKLTKGDILIHTPSAGQFTVVVVGAVDTKNKTARSKFKGRKLVTETI